MNNLLKERDKRTKQREKAKAKFDKMINLSSISKDDGMNIVNFAVGSDNGKVRLLDEGAIVTASGDLDIYIMKGAIRKYMNGKNKELPNLPPNYTGTINIGHNSFATFPVGIVGEWTLDDFHMTNNGEGRKGLDVDLNLNYAHPLVQALVVQGYPVGVSVEMAINIDYEKSEEYGYPMVNEILIRDFAIVGECGNVGSSNTVDLKGGLEMNKDKMNLEVETVEEVETPEEEVEVETEATESEETTETVEETADDTEETEEESAEQEEEEIDDSVIESEEAESEEAEVEETADDEAEGDEAFEKAMAMISDLTKKVDALIEENKTLTAKLEAADKASKKKSKKLKELNEAQDKFTEKFKGLSVNLGLVEEEEINEAPKDERYANGSIIGE